MQKKKMGFFEGFAKSFYSFKDYPRYRYIGDFKILMYIFLLSFILAVSGFISIARIGYALNDVLKNDLPPWKFVGTDRLKVNNKMFFCDFGGKNIERFESLPEAIRGNAFAIDTSVQFYISVSDARIYVLNPSTKKILSSSEISTKANLFLVGKYGISIMSNGETEYLQYSSLPEGIKKLIEYDSIINIINILLWAAAGIVFIYSVFSVFFGCLIQTFISAVQNKSNKNNSFGMLLNMSLYARTIPTIIVFIISILGISIPFLCIINYIIGAVFMHKALKATRAADLAKTALEDNGGYTNSGSYTDVNNYSGDSYK